MTRRAEDADRGEERRGELTSEDCARGVPSDERDVPTRMRRERCEDGRCRTCDER